MRNENMEMLKSIKQDGKTWLCARDALVHYEGEGFVLTVNGEEYGWYPNMKEILPDIKELQEDRPFIKKEMLI